MNKKIITIALAFTLPLTVAAFPGDKSNIEAHHADRIEHLTKSLNLNAEQKTKLKAIIKEQAFSNTTKLARLFQCSPLFTRLGLLSETKVIELIKIKLIQAYPPLTTLHLTLEYPLKWE